MFARSTWMGLGIVGALWMAGVSAHASDHPMIESDSGIRGPAYPDLVNYFYSLQAKYPGGVSVVEYGRTIKDRQLLVLRITKPVNLRKRLTGGKAILITGAIHGDEYLNIEDRLPEWFVTDGLKVPAIREFLDHDGTIYIAPILNPDGYVARERENNNGTDLNRDFSVKSGGHVGFKEPETRALRDFVKKEIVDGQRQLAITLDYHCCIGAALYPWSYSYPKPPAVPAVDMARFKSAGDIIKQAFGKDFPVGTTPDILGYSALGTTKDYYYENYGSISFTFEGEYKNEKNKFATHAEMWGRLIQALNQQQFSDRYLHQRFRF